MTVAQELLPPPPALASMQNQEASLQDATSEREEAAQEALPDGDEGVESIKDPTGGQKPILDEVRKRDTSDDLQETVKYVMDVFQAYKEARGVVIESSWSLSEDLYDGIVREAIDPHLSLYEIKEIYKQGESAKARSAQVFFPATKRFDFKANSEGGEDAANAASHIVAKQMKSLGCWKQLVKWHDQCFHLGTSYLRYDWAKFKRIKHKFTQAHDQRDGTERWDRDYEEVEHGGPWFEFVDAWKTFANPFIEEIEDMPFFFVQEIVSLEYMRTLVNEGQFDAETLEKIANNENASADPEGDAERARDVAVPRKLFGDEDQHTLTWCWTSTGWVYAIVDDKHLVRANRNVMGRIPFFVLKDNPRPGMHYGISMPLILEAVQKLVRDVASLWVDTIFYKLQPVTVAAEGLRNQIENTPLVPGAIFYTERPGEDIKNLSPDTHYFELKDAIEYFREDMKRTTGETDEKSGSTNHRTASGIMMLKQAAGARDEHRILLWTPVFEDVYQTAYDLNAAFLNERVKLRYEGTNGREAFGTFDPTVFEPDVDVEVQLPHTMDDPNQQRQLWLTCLQLSQGDPSMDKSYILEQFGRSMELRHPRRLIKDTARSLQDAIEENNDFQAQGYIVDPSPFDEHQVHLQEHIILTQSPEFQALDPMLQQKLQRHMSIHAQYFRATQQAAQMAQQAQMEAPGGSPMPGQAEGNAMAENRMMMGTRGAMQKGQVKKRV